jgi:hypothetical protein
LTSDGPMRQATVICTACARQPLLR